jgi:hypothetical protein
MSIWDDTGHLRAAGATDIEGPSEHSAAERVRGVEVGSHHRQIGDVVLDFSLWDAPLPEPEFATGGPSRK